MKNPQDFENIFKLTNKINQSMHQRILIITAALCNAFFAYGQDYTTPVGYLNLGDTTSGQPAVKANTDVIISVPLVRPTEYSGSVLSTTNDSITVAGAPGWSSNFWVPAPSTPYLVTINSGVENGFLGLITSNTNNSLTITPATAGSLTNVGTGDRIQIFKAWTLGSFIPSSSVPSGTSFLLWTGTSSGINVAPNLILTSDGNQWKSGSTVYDDHIVYPGESFVLRTGATPIQTLAVIGEVATANSRTSIDKLSPSVAQDTRIGYLGANEEIIGQSGLVASMGIMKGDLLLVFNNNTAGINKSASETLQFSGTHWRKGPITVTDTYTLKPGRGYVLRRAVAAPVGSLDWKDQPAYLPFNP